jgi:hypothetical protein
MLLAHPISPRFRFAVAALRALFPVQREVANYAKRLQVFRAMIRPIVVYVMDMKQLLRPTGFALFFPEFRGYLMLLS